MLTARQQAILRAYSWWQVAQIATDVDHGVSHAVQSREGHRGGALDYDTTAGGIHAAGQGWAETLGWGTVRRWARSLPQGLVGQLREALAAYRKVNAEAPTYTYDRTLTPEQQQAAQAQHDKQWQRWSTRERAARVAAQQLVRQAIAYQKEPALW